MSKMKSKSGKDSKPDTLTKVKDSVVTKPSQTLKSKTKDLAEAVGLKNEKKQKKTIKEPTPETSSSEESDSDVESQSEDDSESDSDAGKASQVNGKMNGVKKTTKSDSSDESEDDSDDSESDSEVDTKTKTTNGINQKTAVSKDANETDQSSSDESDDDTDLKTETKAPKDKKVDDSDSDEDSDDSDDSEDSDESVEEKVEVKTNATKRKVEEEAIPVAKKSKTEAVDSSKSPNLFVGNLSWNVDEEWLKQEFEEFGELSGVRLMTDRQTGRSKGFGYVEYVEVSSAIKAHAAKRGTELDGRPINVDFANAKPNGNDKQENRRKSYGDQTGEPTETLFLGNLPFDVGQETVSEAFGPHGTILSVRLPTDRETGQPKGFGYVSFASVDEAKVALEAMQGAYINGRPVRLDFSQPRPQNDFSNRGGFGGGRGRGGGFNSRGRGGGGRGDRGGFRGGRGATTNRGGFGDFSGKKVTF